MRGPKMAAYPGFAYDTRGVCVEEFSALKGRQPIPSGKRIVL